MVLQTKINDLCHLTHELLYLGIDGTPIYSNRFCELNSAVYKQAESLFRSHGSNVEEEAQLCYVLLSAYHATIYDHGNKSQKVQKILNRSREVLEQVSASLLKCQLLVACYGETFEEELAREAHAIINSWEGRVLTSAECEVFEYLNGLESTPQTSLEVEE